MKYLLGAVVFLSPALALAGPDITSDVVIDYELVGDDDGPPTARGDAVVRLVDGGMLSALSLYDQSQLHVVGGFQDDVPFSLPYSRQRNVRFIDQSRVVISGGEIQGQIEGDSPNISSEVTGGQIRYLRLRGGDHVVSGGRIELLSVGGYFEAGEEVAAATLEIHPGADIGFLGTGSFPSLIDIHGGTFGVLNLGGEGVQIVVNDATVLGDFSVWTQSSSIKDRYSSTEINGGTFHGPIRAYGDFNRDPETRLLGGEFLGGLLVYQRSAMEVRGGAITGEVIVHPGGTLYLYGDDFDFSGGRMRGILEDGSAIDAPYRVFSQRGTRPDARVFLNGRRADVEFIPEPSAAGLAAFAAAAILAATRRRPR